MPKFNNAEKVASAINAVNSTKDNKKIPILLKNVISAVNSFKSSLKTEKSSQIEKVDKIAYINAKIVQLKTKVEKTFTEINGHLDAAASWAGTCQALDSETIPPIPPEILNRINECLSRIQKYQVKLNDLMAQQSEILKNIDSMLTLK